MFKIKLNVVASHRRGTATLGVEVPDTSAEVPRMKPLRTYSSKSAEWKVDRLNY